MFIAHLFMEKIWFRSVNLSHHPKNDEEAGEGTILKESGHAQD